MMNTTTRIAEKSNIRGLTLGQNISCKQYGDLFFDGFFETESGIEEITLLDGKNRKILEYFDGLFKDKEDFFSMKKAFDEKKIKKIKQFQRNSKIFMVIIKR